MIGTQVLSRAARQAGGSTARQLVLDEVLYTFGPRAGVMNGVKVTGSSILFILFMGFLYAHKKGALKWS